MKTLKQSLIFFTFMTVLLCGAYPALILGVSHVFFTEKAKGSLLTHKKQVVGSELIAQEFTSDKFFWARPSAASYNGNASSGSNLSIINKDHQGAVLERKSKGLDYDLLTASASGLDPHISPRAALLQVNRVAMARGITTDALLKIVRSNIEGRQLGLLGEERVNVLKLNLILENSTHE